MSTAPFLPIRLPALGRDSEIVVALSGGLDSTVLLHALAAMPEARAHGLRAVHVHHGLSGTADAWVADCERLCASLQVPLRVLRVQVDRRSGLGLEGAAREARHAALAAELRPGDLLALAHHRDDQAETFLLRALRASGPDGLAAMRMLRPFAQGFLWRPLLDVAREDLHAYATAHALEWIEDPANASLEHDRNFLRHRVLPLLRERWPHADAAFARAAALNADAADLLREDDRIALDAARTDAPDVLSTDALRTLAAPRRARVLRQWIASLDLPPLPAEGIAQIESDLALPAPDTDFVFAWSGAELRRWRGRLRAARASTPMPPHWSDAWDGRAPLILPDGGALELIGTPAFDAPLQVRLRAGGERIVLPGRTHSHSLKHALQDAAIPPWERERLPLLCDAEGTVLAAGDRLLSATLDAWLQSHNAHLRWLPPSR
ncbi:tRNA lysidine(34) synthetase TilS [Lysobacter sp. KIS68-7]|uniref:tRNA lysidine(34) synthetase TilS n=1 Tax=Lysobacter sp. KIS68-7 TaxID=2904252 RepID=UPI001E3A5210|nr:tRNA lysidine(34) synthetase TilS [Lysobacter sp. KIS68-7]UHQ19443.1 tRNA lysidine(34) synthetase TilS [Lysobacter sp. KIS68-7]